MILTRSVKQRSIVIALTVTLAVLAGVLLPTQYARVVCCSPPNPPSRLGQGWEVTTAPAATLDVALLFYYFQLNGTTGDLLVVLQNVGSLNTSLSGVYYDDSPFSSSFVTSSGACALFVIGSECRLTLAFGPGSLLPPAQGTSHSLAVVTAGGNRFEYMVAAGAGGADCGLAHC